tara:strand:- start:412 stop:828 length:417 start_codon:yes stop_codon:yes gene_type:complete
MSKLELFVSFLFFLIIIVSILYYPIFAIEYFSVNNAYNVENVEQIQKCISCSSYDPEKKDKVFNFVDSLEINDNDTSSNTVLPVLIDKENDISKIFNEDDFDPSCCPSMITSGSGCACITPELNSFLETRGNNRNTCY